MTLKPTAQLVTVQGVAARFDVPVSWVYMKAESGELPSYKIGRYRRFEIREVEQWLQAQRQGGNGLSRPADLEAWIEANVRTSTSDPGQEAE